MNPQIELVHAGELVTMGDGKEGGLGIIEDGALVAEGGRISWVGTTKELGRKSFGKASRRVDAGGHLVTPGFVDSHTHALFAGSREDELGRKATGETYMEILSSGGGILRTIKETRRAPMAVLLQQTGERLGRLLRNGVTTVEVKTGYGQSLGSELKLMGVLAKLSKTAKMEVVPTFLGLHAKPPEFRSSSDYAKHATDVILPAVAKLKMKPMFSDCFCEEGVFSTADCSRYLRASKSLGFRLKVHADEFSDSGGASLAARLRCVSADHLGRSSEEGIRSMGKAGVTAVLLPGTSLYSGIPFAEAKKIGAAGCSVALATDLSPNSWVESPQFVMGLACTAMRMTPAQALRGFTVNAAKALGRSDIGRLVPGCRADFLIHGMPNHMFLPYRIGSSYLERVFKDGAEAYSALAS